MSPTAPEIEALAQARMDRWQNKLLDLSRRNPLLALRSSRGLAVLAPDPVVLAQRLIEGRTVLPVAACSVTASDDPKALELSLESSADSGEGSHPSPTGEDSPESGASATDPRGVADESSRTSEQMLARGRRRRQRNELDESVRTVLDLACEDERTTLIDAVDPESLQDDLAEMARAARARREETGAGALFLVVGVLRWREKTPKSGAGGGTARRGVSEAPLFLVPVDLARANARCAFGLSLRDEEIVLNPALAHLLERELGFDWTSVRAALNGATKDEAGEDAAESEEGLSESQSEGHGGRMAKAMACLRKTLEGENDLEILDQTRLALLSYAKHSLWQDLRARGSMVSAHPLVRGLMVPTPETHAGRTGNALNDLSEREEWNRFDANHPAADLALPLPCDASQLRAIARIERGDNLVIQGPPGTGKSQTIANLIAHGLAQGRRVLFVAEKNTAVGVVHDQLRALGLGAFCLEAHASRCDKVSLLRQLREALDARMMAPVAGFAEAARRIQAQRMALNQGLTHLHEVYPNGLSVFGAIGALADLDGENVRPERPAGLVFARILEENTQAQPDRREAMGGYWAARDALPDSAGVFGRLRSVARDHATELFESMDRWVAVRAEMARWTVGVCTPWPRDELTRRAEGADEAQGNDRLDGWGDLLGLWEVVGQLDVLDARDSPGRMATLCRAMRDPAVRESWRALHEADTAYNKAWAPFGAVLHASLVGDGGAARTAWTRWKSGVGPWRWWRRRQALAVMAVHVRAGQRISVGRVDAVMTVWPQIAGLREAAKVAGDALREHLGPDMIKHDEWGLARKACDWARSMEEALARCRRWPGAMEEVMRSIEAEIAVPGSTVLCQHGGERGRAAVASVQALRELLEGPLGVAVQEASGRRTHAGALSLNWIDSTVNGWRAARAAWPAWEACERWRERCQGLGLEALIAWAEAGQIEGAALGVALERAWLETFVEQARMRRPEDHAWQGHNREAAIARFARDDAAFETLSQQHLAARVALRAREADVDRLPGMSLLRREISKQRQHLPARSLLRQAGAVVAALKPCMMMSPLSAAEILGNDTPEFDLVIFDEASQIPVADAIGAIARARQMVVVGDPMQMPPSRYFSASEDEGDEEGAVEDLASILDECLASMDHVMLNWHYRSRSEDLIAFSNHRYYKGELITFPTVEVAADADGEGSRGRAETQGSGRGLVVHDVGGLYDRGGSQTNLEEARRVVARMGEHLRGSATPASLGVVTFNQRQQRLIERLWDRELRSDPGLEGIAGRLTQELVIKNLDNVQGEERDVILFSTTFGRDAGGRFSMGFGPLSQMGGERRLNVAITRARERLEVFCSFLPEDIDTRHLTHAGVTDLRDWLSFARGGPAALAAVASPSLGLPDSPFEIEVARALRARGWTVRAQIGCSGYKIDLAVVDPQKPGRYLAGVECDGATYHSFKIARDRDRQRQRILEGLGWAIERVWSTDWFADARGEIDRLDARLRSLMGSDRG